MLLHPTSLPSGYGIGDIGSRAIEFLDILDSMGASYWQMLPLNPSSLGNSPYSADSAFAGNPLLISPEDLVSRGLLTEQAIETNGYSDGKVSFDTVKSKKMDLFQASFRQFIRDPLNRADLESFIEINAFWLKDYACFCVLKECYDQRCWQEWPDELKNRHPDVIQAFCAKYADQILFHCFLQFIFFHQWETLHQQAGARNIQLIGDIPIFVALDSADVWSHSDLFQLDDRKRPICVAGVPPDYFSPTGQKWGNPHYNWEVMKDTGYQWWIDRFRIVLSLVDIVRIDHFRGFEAYWSIPASADTAESGEWIPGPGKAIFEIVEGSLGSIPVIAEDLGIITPEVDALRESLGFPGMKILQFAFGGNATNPYLPFNHSQEHIVYTGTHDNDTTRGWWESMRPDQRDEIAEQIRILQGHSVEHITRDLVRMALGSVCRLAVIPVQDILDLGSDSRMNIPGTATGNWEWCLAGFDTLKQQAPVIRQLVQAVGREPRRA